MLEIYCGSCPVIFTTGMNGCWIAEAAKVFCHCFRNESRGLRAPTCQTPAQVILWLGAYQTFWQVIGLNQKEPVVVGGGNCLDGAQEHTIGRATCKHHQLLH